jgi:hypothetical protein
MIQLPFFKTARKLLMLDLHLLGTLKDLKNRSRVVASINHYTTINYLLRLHPDLLKSMELTQADHESEMSDTELLLGSMVTGLQLSHAVYQDLLEMFLVATDEESQQEVRRIVTKVLDYYRGPKEIAMESIIRRIEETEPSLKEEIDTLFRKWYTDLFSDEE